MALTFMSLYSFQCIMLVIVWQKIKLVIPPIFCVCLLLDLQKCLYQITSHGILLLPQIKLVLSGHDGDDAKPYQLRDVSDALRSLKEVKGE